jgi:hypothetical protein
MPLDVRGRMRATMRDAMCPRYVCVNNIAFIYNNTTLAVLSNSVVRVVLTLTFRNVNIAPFVSLVISFSFSIQLVRWAQTYRLKRTQAKRRHIRFEDIPQI